MAHVKIEAGQNGPRVEIDGHPVEDLVSLNLSFRADALAECRIQTYLSTPFLFEGEAQVVYERPYLPEGCVLMDITTHNDKYKRFLVTREK